METHWSLAAVAGRYLRIIEGDVPAEWRWDPTRQRYLYGSGMSREVVASTVQGLTESSGAAGLALGHSPDLATRILEMAKTFAPKAGRTPR